METIISQLNFLKYTKEDFYNYKTEVNIEILDVIKQKINLIHDKINKNSKTTIHNSFEKIDKRSKFAKSWRISKTLVKKNEINKTEQFANEINSLLNKLSPKNFDKISNNILEYYEKDEVTIEMLKELIFSTINNIFSKAVLQPVYCPYYVKLLNILDKKFETNDLIDKKCSEYKDVIKNNTLDGHEADNDNDNDNNSAEADNDNDNDNNSAEATPKPKNEEQEKYDIFCKEIKEKKTKEGYSQFIGELYNNNMIKYETLEINISTFFEILEEEIKKESQSDSVEYLIICLCKLFLTINKKLDKPNIRIIIKKFKIVQQENLIKRLKFKIMDITDKYKYV
jgi:hypothetical protein